MSEVLAKWAKAKHNGQSERKSDRPQDDELRPGEQKALDKIQKEAKQVKSFLTTGGKGGLPPSLVLGVMRRDKYTCKTCGQKGSKENGGLGVHHKGGVAESKWLSAKGHTNDPNNLVSICANCHDKVHEKARAEGVDSSQVTPDGDK